LAGFFVALSGGEKRKMKRKNRDILDILVFAERVACQHVPFPSSYRWPSGWTIPGKVRRDCPPDEVLLMNSGNSKADSVEETPNANRRFGAALEDRLMVDGPDQLPPARRTSCGCDIRARWRVSQSYF
jgi:hypothetical protein